eukprot:13825600-Heterocapsa_arctica.AAC.1
MLVCDCKQGQPCHEHRRSGEVRAHRRCLRGARAQVHRPRGELARDAAGDGSASDAGAQPRTHRRPGDHLRVARRVGASM